MQKSKIDIINLDSNLQYIDEYINLRNRFKDKLLTDLSYKAQTLKWIKDNSNYIRVAIKDSQLIGVVILYTAKNNEIAIFTKYHKQGIASLLLKDIENIAIENKLKHLHSWIQYSNKKSKNLFLKQKFLLLKESFKEHNNQKHLGEIYQKELIH